MAKINSIKPTEQTNRDNINSPTKFAASERNRALVNKVESKGTDIVNSLGASLNDMYAGIAKLPRYVYELAAVPQNFIADKLNAPEWRAEYDDLLYNDGAAIVSPLTALDRVGDYYAGKAEEFKAKQTKYDAGVFDSLKEGRYGDAGSQIVNNIVASAPQMLLMAMTDGAGSVGKLGNVSKTAINSLPFASSKANEIRDDENIPTYAKPIISALYGLSEVIPDQAFGSQAIIRKIQSQITEEGVEAGLRTGKDLAEGYIKKAFSNIKEPLSDLAKNSLEEMSTQFSQNLIDKIAVDPNKDLMEGVVDAGIIGAVQGGGLGSISAVIGKSKENIAKKNEQISKLTDDLDNPDLPEGAKDVISEKIGTLKKEVQQEVEVSNKEFEALDEKGKEDYLEKGAKVDAIEKSIQSENISEDAKAVLTEQKKLLEEEISEIKPSKELKVTEELIAESGTESATETVKLSTIEKIEADRARELEEEALLLLDGATKQQTEEADRVYQQQLKDHEAEVNAKYDKKLKSLENETLKKPNLGVARKIEDKESIDRVKSLYSSKEELKDIGTEEQYRRYVESIFPKSTNKKVYFHNTTNNKTARQGFDEDFQGQRHFLSNSDQEAKPIYVTYNKDYYSHRGSKFPVIVDVSNTAKIGTDIVKFDDPKIREYKKRGFDSASSRGTSNEISKLPVTEMVFGPDALDVYYPEGHPDRKFYDDAYKKENVLTEDLDFAVFDPKKVHVLGSDKDIDGFRKFVENDKPVQTEIKDKDVQAPAVEETAEVSEKVLAKAEDDLKALKQVENKKAKYDGSIKRLTEAKNAKLITEKEFNELKNRFDDVIADSAPKTSKDVEVSLQEPRGEVADNSDSSTESEPQPKADVGTGEQKAEKPSRKEEIKVKRQTINDRIAEKLKSQRGKLSSGFDPSLISDFIELGATYIEEGVADVTEFIKRFRSQYKEYGLDDSKITDEQIRDEIYSKVSKEDPQVSGIKKALVSDDIISKVNIDKISDREMQELGKQLVESGEVNPKDIVDEIAGVKGKGGSKRALQPKEVVSLIYYKATLDNQRRELLKEYNEEGSDKGAIERKLSRVEDDITNYDVMAVITAQQQSLAFRLRKGLLDKDYNLVEQIEQYKKTNGGEIPADVLKRFKELDRELKEVKEKLAEAERKAIEAEEAKSISNIIEDVERSSKTRKSVLSPKEQARKNELAKKYRVFNDITRVVTIFAEKDFREYAKLVLKEAKGEFKAFAVEILKTVGIDATPLLPKLYEEIGGKQEANLDDLVDKPYVRESDGELVIPEAYIRSLVEKGVTDIDKLSEAVKKAVEEDLPNITLREVRDAITRYGRTVNQTSDDIKRQINEAKRLGRLYSGLEDLQQKGERAKTVKQRTAITAEERELQRQIDILENGLPKTREEIRTEARKKYLQKFIREREERLATKNFAPKPKLPPIFKDSETIRLETEAQKIRDEYDAAHYENEQANRPKAKKIYDAVIGWGTGIQRTLQAGLDASAFLVQGVISVGSQSPLKTAQAVAESWKFLKSEKYENEFFSKLKAQPDYQLMKDSGLALNYPNSKLGSMDYQLQGSEINKVWKYLVAYPTKIFGDKVYEAVLKFNPYRATERSFTGAIDTLRVQMFREFSQVLQTNGITFESNPEQYKIAANAVNNMTFRGRLRNLEGISKELSVVFFAPRKIAATLSLTNPFYWGHMMGSSPTVAKRAILKMAAFISLATTLALSYKAFDDEEDDNPDVFNPLSPDFMKLRIGNTRLDFFGGLNQNVVLFARMLSGKYKTSSSSEVKKLGANSFVPTRWELGMQYFTNKFAPTMAVAYRGMNQSAGRKVDWDEEATKGFMPIWTQNVKELYKEHPETMASFLTAMAFFGQNMGTYGGAEFLERGKDDRLLELVESKGAQFPTLSRANTEVIDKKTLEDRALTKAEFEEYKDDYGNYIKTELKERYSELKDMPVLKFEKTMRSIKSAAKKYAEEEISGIKESLLTVEKDNTRYELTPEQVAEREKMNKSYIRSHSGRVNTLTFKYRRQGLGSEQARRKAEKELYSEANSKSARFILKRNTRGGKVMLKEKQ